jgi:flagellar FliL protein
MATSPKAAAAKPEDPAAPKASNKKMIIGGAVGLIVAIAAGGGGWYFAKGKESHDAAPHVEEVKPVHVKPAIFVPLEPYTVNLKRETSDQYLQIGISLKVYEAPIELQIKENQPEIRSKILQLLTTKTATELLTQEGKTKLAKEIATLGNAVIGIVPPPVVYAQAPQPLPVAPAVVDPHAPATAAPVADPHAPVAAPVAAPIYAPVPVEPKGIIDVLFTSFIIQ